MALSVLLLATGSVHSQTTDALNFKTFGAVGDGITDDTAAIQAAITQATNSTTTPKTGGGVFCPTGTYRITTSLVVPSVFGFHFNAVGGCILLWAGNNSTPLLDLQGTANSAFDGFQISANPSFPLAEGIRLHHPIGSNVAPRSNAFSNLICDGTNGQIKYCFRGALGAGDIDADLDFVTYTNVRATNYSVAGWIIEGTQMHGWSFKDCSAVSDGFGQYGIRASANIVWTGGFVGGNTVDDFYSFPPASPDLVTVITDVGSEGSARFYESYGGTGSGHPTLFQGIRFASNALNADGYALKFQDPGPYSIYNSAFGEDYTRAVKIYWSYIAGFFHPELRLVDTMIKGSLSAMATLFPLSIPTDSSGLTAQTSDNAFAYLDLTRVNAAMVPVSARLLGTNSSGQLVAVAAGAVFNLTPGTIPKAATPTSLADSSLKDNGTVVSTTEPILSGTTTTGIAGSFAGAINGEFNGAVRSDRIGVATQYVEIFGGNSGLAPGFHAFSAAKGMTFGSNDTIVGQFDSSNNWVASFLSKGLGFVVGGTAANITGCANKKPTGGLTAGTFTSGTTGVCKVSVGFAPSAAPNGWSCAVNNQTSTNLMRQTGSTTTGVTLSGTTVAGDLINFSCIGF